MTDQSPKGDGPRFAELQRRDQFRATARFMRRIARKVLRGPPDKEKGEPPAEEGSPEVKKPAAENLIRDQPSAQLPTGVTEIYDFALNLFGQEFRGKANGSLEAFRERMDKPYLFSLHDPGKLVPEKAYISGALAAVLALHRQSGPANQAGGTIPIPPTPAEPEPSITVFGHLHRATEVFLVQTIKDAQALWKTLPQPNTYAVISLPDPHDIKGLDHQR